MRFSENFGGNFSYILKIINLRKYVIRNFKEVSCKCPKKIIKQTILNKFSINFGFYMKNKDSEIV